MLEKKDINKIKEAVEEFFEKMTITASNIGVGLSSEISKKEISEDGLSDGAKKDFQNEQDLAGERPEGHPDIIDLDIKLDEPQVLIGQQGQTLLDIQRLLRMVLNRKLSQSQGDRGSSTLSGQKVFYLNLDINDYKKKKIEYLKDLAKNLADQVSLTKEEKAFLPMSSYERRIIHSELSQRTDISTESHGDGFDRHVVIKPR